MTLGEKIRKYRILQNLSQKELGLQLGFSNTTADVRIRQYESGTKTPRDDIRQKMAEILDVDISALSDIAIQSDEDVMQVLFYLSEILYMDIEKTDDKFYLSFPVNHIDREQLMSYLNVWYTQKKNLQNTVNGTSDDSVREYELWESRFPKDIKQYWKQQLKKLNAYYAPLIDNIKEKNKPVETITDFLCHIRSMIQSGLKFEINQKTFRQNIAALSFCFLIDDLLEPKNKAVENSFVEFLYILKTLEAYGMTVKVELLTFEKGTQISYFLCLSQLAAFSETIENLQNFEDTKETKNDWETHLFESTYEKNLKRFEMNLKEEIEKIYKNSLLLSCVDKK